VLETSQNSNLHFECFTSRSLFFEKPSSSGRSKSTLDDGKTCFDDQGILCDFELGVLTLDACQFDTREETYYIESSFNMLQQRFQRAVLSEARRRCSSRGATARPFVSMTRPMWEKHTVAVPTMGDSITEVC
jgi:hypothetical protein